MKLIIDIDDEDYKRIQDIPDVFNSLTSRTYSAIRNGTPLPEHHGRIIDESKIHTVYTHTETNINNDIKSIRTIITRTDAPTIIEGSEAE